MDLVVRRRTESVREAAYALGFSAVGFAAADDVDPDRRLAKWVEAGRAAGMTYMAEGVDEREDPRRIVPGASTVIALAISYFSPEYAPGGPLKVSRYAALDDYHKVVRKRIRRLRKRLLELDPDAVVKPTVDTSRVLERAWAQRAGIAWIGKSTMAIGKKLGTYTFLATLITTMELALDEPHTNHCGTCTRCLDACPTDAFVGPYELDSNRCITYWNVEHDGDLDVAPPLHDWVAGCDICQEVCPWNKFASPTQEPRFAIRSDLGRPDVAVFTEDSREAALAETLQGTPLQRTGTKSIRRNARRILADASPVGR